MLRTGVLLRLALFARKYTVTAALVFALAAAMIQVATTGTGPMPQQPPDGYVAASRRVSLEWNKGTRKAPVTLEVSVDDPSFSKPILKKPVNGVSHPLASVLPGKTYYWRLVQNGAASPTASFEVPLNYVDF